MLSKNFFLNSKILNVAKNTNSASMFNFQFFNFATKMRAGVTKNQKDSAGRRLGLKKFGGEEVVPGNILVRQRGFQWKQGENIYHGSDHTFHARKEGKVSFYRDPWSTRRRTHVNVIEQETPNRKLFPPKPFMYHPELYPELAHKNKVFERLEIPSEKRIIKNKFNNPEENSHKLNEENANIIIEDVIKEGQENKLTAKSSKFLQAYRKANKEKGKFKPELATNFYLIDSIKEEINKTGEIYLGINNLKSRGDLIDNYMNIFEAQKNFSFYEFNQHTNKLEDEKLNITSKYSPSIEVEKNRANYLNTSAPLLEDLIEELKSENRINSTIDLSGIPSTENAYGKIVKNPQENLKKIKEYFDKMENLKAKNFVKKSKENKKSQNLKNLKNEKKNKNKN